MLDQHYSLFVCTQLQCKKPTSFMQNHAWLSLFVQSSAIPLLCKQTVDTKRVTAGSIDLFGFSIQLVINCSLDRSLILSLPWLSILWCDWQLKKCVNQPLAQSCFWHLLVEQCYNMMDSSYSQILCLQLVQKTVATRSVRVVKWFPCRWAGSQTCR